MTLVYFDSSALVKLLVEERGSDLVSEMWDRCAVAVSSRLAGPEVAAALAAARRAQRLRADQHDSAMEVWRACSEELYSVELTATLARQAAGLAGDHRLCGADAVHLASALQLGDGTVVATWDHRLHEAALAVGLAVVPATVDGDGIG